MKIQSDETPKRNRIQELLKKYETNEIFKVALKFVLIIFLITFVLVTLQYVYKNGKDDKRAAEQQIVDQIVKYKPVIKYYTNYFLPDEYELIDSGGRYELEVTPKGLPKDTVLLSNCNLLLSKKVTDSFREAVYQKRGYVSEEQAKIETEKRRKIAEQKRLEEERLEKERKERLLADRNKTIDLTKTAIHSYDFYERKAYADGYEPLVEAHSNLETYKLTEDYKQLQRFERTKELEALNMNYNTKRARMWSLHYKFGLQEGTFDQLQNGELGVDMINGKLEFRYNL